MPIVAQIYQAGNILIGFPLHWNSKIQQVESQPHPKKRIFWILVCLLLVLANVQLSGKFHKKRDIGNLSIGLFSIIGFSISFAYLLSFQIESSQIAECFNGLIQIEKKSKQISYKQMIPRYRLQLTKCIVTIFAFSGIMCPVLLAFGSMIMPQSPINCLAILEQIQDINCQNLLSRITTFAFNVSCWQVLCIYGSAGACHILIGCKSIQDFLEAFQLGIKEKYTRTAAISYFRQIQLICKSYNKSHAGTLINTLLVCSVSLSVILYTLMKFITSDFDLPAALVLCYDLFAFNCTAILLGVYGCAAEVNSKSLEIKTRIMCSANGEPNKELRRLFLSFPLISIKFGNGRSIESKTVLLFFDFSIARFIDLVLLDKSKQSNFIK